MSEVLGKTPDAPDVARLIESIKQPAPANIAFTEVRFSRLLKQPTIVGGQLSFLGAGRFDRVVEQPYRERTEIRNDSVRVSREHEPARTFALQRAPELRTMLLTFSAVLSGDQAVIERDFRLSAQGDMQHWHLELVPLDERIRRRLNHVSIIGKDETPQCFAIYTRDGAVSILLLGTLASVDLASRATASPLTQDSLLQRCRSGR